MFAIEACQLAHEGVEAAVCAGQFFQRPAKQAGRSAGPHQQSQMREIAALIDRVLSAPDDRDTIAAVKGEVKALADAYPLYRAVAPV